MGTEIRLPWVTMSLQIPRGKRRMYKKKSISRKKITCAAFGTTGHYLHFCNPGDLAHFILPGFECILELQIWGNFGAGKREKKYISSLNITYVGLAAPSNQGLSKFEAFFLPPFAKCAFYGIGSFGPHAETQVDLQKKNTLSLTR